MASNSTKTKREFMNALKDHMCNISFFVESWFKQSSHHWLNLDAWYMNTKRKGLNENYLLLCMAFPLLVLKLYYKLSGGMLEIVCNTI